MGLRDLNFQEGSKQLEVLGLVMFAPFLCLGFRASATPWRDFVRLAVVQGVECGMQAGSN